MRLLMAAQWRTVMFSLFPFVTSSPHTSTRCLLLHVHTNTLSPSSHQSPPQLTSPGSRTAPPPPERTSLGQVLPFLPPPLAPPRQSSVDVIIRTQQL